MRGIYRIKMVQCKDFGLESTECPVELLYWTSPRAEDLMDFEKQTDKKSYVHF